MTEAGASPQVGSIAEETYKLIRALSKQPLASPESTSDHVCDVGWCPVCQIVGFVRDNPDVVAQVSQSAATMKRSISDLIEAALAAKDSR